MADNSDARFEFRCWARNFGMIETRIRRLSECHGKRRFAFTVNDCMTELVEVWINGAGLHTVAVESTDPAAVSETKSMLGLDDLENVNYLRAIKRVIGMEPLRTPY